MNSANTYGSEDVTIDLIYFLADYRCEEAIGIGEQQEQIEAAKNLMEALVDLCLDQFDSREATRECLLSRGINKAIRQQYFLRGTLTLTPRHRLLASAVLNLHDEILQALRA